MAETATTQFIATGKTINPEAITQANTIAMIKNTGLSELFETISNEFNLKTFDEQTDIPIPPDKLPNNNYQIEINPEIEENLKGISEIINDDLKLEFPFCLTGKIENNKININSMRYLYTDSESLSAKIVYPDEKIFNNKLNTAIKDPDTNIFILGHTHPNVPEELKKTTIAAKISKEEKEKFGIREPGLNISVGDLHQLESVKEQVGSKIKMMSAVLMYNGELVIIGADNNQFSQTTKQL